MLEVSASGVPSKCVGKLKFRPEKQKGSNPEGLTLLDKQKALSLHVYMGKRHDRLPWDRPAKGLGRNEDGKQQSAAQLRLHFFVIAPGNDAEIFHTPRGIHVRFNDHGRIQAQLVFRILRNL